MQNLDDKSSDVGFSMIYTLLILLSVFIVWAAVFKFDTTVRASGKLIPSARTQVIQVVDGGVLSQLLVREGTIVEAGDVLAVLEKERATAKFEEESSRVIALEIALLRAEAEANNREPNFGSFQATNLDIVKAEFEYYKERKLQLKKEVKVLQSNLKMEKAELDMNKNLLSMGDASRIEVMKAQRQVNNTQGEIMTKHHKYLSDALKEITTIQSELTPLRFKLGAANSILNHTEIISPVAGTVKYMEINTLGGVLNSGDELMQISPSQGGLMVEAEVSPVDIGEINTGMPVFIKLDAFDFSLFGNLQGTLVYISSDTLTKKDSSGHETVFYSIKIKVDEEHLAFEPKLAAVKLKPGMNVMVDVKTGEKTVLDYLTKPITKAFSGAIH